MREHDRGPTGQCDGEDAIERCCFRELPRGAARIRRALFGAAEDAGAKTYQFAGCGLSIDLPGVMRI